LISADTYTSTNPALCSLVLWSFLNGFEQTKKDGCELPILFLPLPLIISKTIRNKFDGSNNTTGLLTWVARNPSVLINVGQRIEVTKNITKEAILFGATNEVFNFNDDGLVFSNKKGIKVSKVQSGSHFENDKEMLLTARRLGSWCGQLESTKTIFNVLGVSL